MALDNYADLSASISGWLHRSDLSSNIPDFITLADSRINNDLRVRQMETTQPSVMAAGVIAVPSNYIEMKDAYISSTSPYVSLSRKTANWIYDAYPNRIADATPKFIGRDGPNFIFGPFPDSCYTVTMTYYNRFPLLVNAINTLFTSYPGLWLFGALVEAAPFLKDDSRVAVWEMKYKQLMKMVQDESDCEYLSGAVPEVTAL